MAGLTLLALFSGALPAFAAEFSAKVVRITDGDSLRVLHEQTEVEIRLEGIDCPEHGQAFGNRAKQAASELAFGKTVTVRPTGKDQYGRTLADIVLPDGKSLNQELVRLGYAWWFRKYSKDETLGRLEAEARQAKRGLWADPKPVAPWEWRKEQRTAELPLSSLQLVPNGVEIAALLPNPAGRDEGHEQVVIRNATSTRRGPRRLVAAGPRRPRVLADRKGAGGGEADHHHDGADDAAEQRRRRGGADRRERCGEEPGGVRGGAGEVGGVDRVRQGGGQVGTPFVLSVCVPIWRAGRDTLSGESGRNPRRHSRECRVVSRPLLLGTRVSN